jgi:serine/threonine-protein kinase
MPAVSTLRMSRDELLATMDLSRVRADHSHDSTLKPTMVPRVRTSRRPLEHPMRATPMSEHLAGSGNTIRVKEPLAEGGMGVVKLAEQGALRREVAIKTLRDDFLDENFIARLMREARITGMVEHPNIVPIYALQADERGAPMMVMKRIEGVSWRTLIRDPRHGSGLVPERDPLAFHLDVLMKVAEAVHFAHSRGILHLDLKPDNVMIGYFHDVYLVDWGVAVSTREEHRGFLPMADEVNEVLGTPAYIAPEMVDVANQRLTEQTDIYLLGAVLHEVLTGRPPHAGGSLHDTLFAAYEARAPELPDAPRELAHICTRAMEPIQSRRYETAEQFRQAIADFLQHKSSAALSAESDRTLTEIRAELGRVRAHADDEDAGRTIQRRFSECRFGFAQSLREWPENEPARDGLVEATLLMAGFHLDRDEAASAEALLGELRDPPAAFHQRIAVLREGVRLAREESDRQKKFSEEQDDTQSRRARAIYVLIAASSLNMPVFLAWVFQQFGLYHYVWWHSIAYSSVLSLFLGVGAAVMRRDLMPNRASRRVIVTLCVLAVLVLVRRFLALKMGQDQIGDMSTDVFLFGAGCAVIGSLTDRRFMAPAVAFTLSAVSILFAPVHTLLWVALAAFCGPGAMAALWLRADRLRRLRDEATAEARARASLGA